jgi:hypothetical protein
MRIYMKKAASLFILSSFLLLSLFLTARAQTNGANSVLLEEQEGISEIQAVFGSQTDVRVSAVRIINVVLSVLGVIFLALIIMAGFKYMTAAGNEDKVKQAIKQNSQAVIGLIIVLASWGISYFIINRILDASQGVSGI